MQSISSVCIKVYPTLYKSQVTNTKPRIVATFQIYPFGTQFMATVDAADFRGNSLWGFGSTSVEEITQRIEAYKGLDQITKDYDC